MPRSTSFRMSTVTAAPYSKAFAAIDTATGPAIFRAREHARRLLDSAKIYRMDDAATRSINWWTPWLELVRVNDMVVLLLPPAS